MNPRPLPLLLLCFATLLPHAPVLAQTTPAAGARAARAPAPAPRPSPAPVTVNFVNADIEAVSRAFAAMLQRPILVDPRVRGTITVYSEQAMSITNAFMSYQTALRGLGFAVVESAGLLKVVPEAEAKLQTGTVSVGAVGAVGVRGDQIITQIFTLRHESANNMVAVLRPLISANNTINVSPGSNALVITDYADNLERIGRIIAALDLPAAGDVDVIPLQHAVASDIAALVQRLATDGGSATPMIPGAAAAIGGATTVVADPRGNALIIRTPNATRLAAVRSIVAKLDRPVSDGQGMWVVHLKNADAAKLATVLRAAFAAMGGGSGGGGGGGGGQIGSPMPGIATLPQAGGGASPQATTPVAASSQPSTGGFVQADPATNSLIITAPEPLYRQVRHMIERLDTRRAQVYIESMIVEVIGDNAADFGFQWQGLLGNQGDRFGVAAGTNLSIGGPSIISLSQTTAGTGSTLPGEGLNIGLLKNYGGTYALAAIARALQTQTSTNIVSTPNLITLDNEEAKIVVGENVPFITGQFATTGTAVSNPFQTIERKDVGITLRIRPQIGEGGTVRMTIYQEQSSVKSTAAVGTSNAGPSTTKRSIESTVVVDDGQIIVLGGLIEDRFVENSSKVPLLGDIPGVGQLFRSDSRTKVRTNLMVFIRPIVMRDAPSVDRVSVDRYEQIRAQQIANQPQPRATLPITGAPVLPELPASRPAVTPKAP